MKQSPQHIWPTDINNRGERKVFELLSQLNLSTYDIALHSLNLHGTKKQQWFELDFLILTRKAIIGIEVKGGRMLSANGKWHLVDNNNQIIYSKFKSPLVQVSEALDAFRTGWFRTNFPEIKNLPFVKLAVLCRNHRPDYKTSTAPPEMLDELVIYEEDLNPAAMKSRLNIAIDHQIRNCHTNTLRELNQDEIDAIAQALRPEIDLTFSTTSSLNAIEEQQKHLTEEQYLLSDRLSFIDRLVIDGGAGTGKTFVLIYSACQALSKGDSVIVVSGSTKLIEFIRDKLPVEIKCIHINALEEELNQPTYDIVFVDEGQDLCNERSIDTIDSILKNGLSKGRWRWFGDFENQFAPTSEFTQEIFDFLLECTGNNSIYKMTHNVRNTPNIVKWLEKVLCARVGETLVRGAGPEVTLIELPKLKQLLKFESVEYGNFELCDITFLYVDESNILKAGLNHEILKGFRVSSIDDFKGLESRIVVVLGLNSLSSTELLREYAYKSISRARSICLILTDENLSKRLRSIKKGI